MDVEQLDPTGAASAIAAGALVLDVREDAEWRAGHLDGALHVPLGDLGARWQELPPADRTVVVCRSGARSDVAASALTRAGRPGCANLAGGLLAWEAEGRPLVPADGRVV